KPFLLGHTLVARDSGHFGTIEARKEMAELVRQRPALAHMRMLRVDRDTGAGLLREAVQSGDSTGKRDVEDAQTCLSLEQISEFQHRTVADAEPAAFGIGNAFRVLLESPGLIAISGCRAGT